jgi:hypothetical protein
VGAAPDPQGPSCGPANAGGRRVERQRGYRPTCVYGLRRSEVSIGGAALRISSVAATAA